MTSKQVNALLLGSALLVSCAQGSEGPGGYGSTPDGGAPVSAADAGTDDDADVGDGSGQPDGHPGTGDGTPGDGTPSDGTPGDGDPGDGDPGLPDAGTPGDGDGTGDGDGDGSGDGDGDGDPGEPMCPATSGCNAATRLSDFNGDDSGQADIVTPGSGSKWFRINVLESSSAPFSGLSVLFELSSIADSNYDLYVYEGCSDTSPDASMNPGAAVERVLQEWGDTLFVDDDRELFVEVRHVSGQCAAWTLSALKP